MTVDALDHFTVVASDLEASRRFYVEALGLREGERPPFDFPGAWLYGGAAPLVHLIAGKDTPAASTGAVDHIAFRARDLAGVVGRLREHGIACTLRTIPGVGLRQVFVHDPDGVKIELNFAVGETLPEGAGEALSESASEALSESE